MKKFSKILVCPKCGENLVAGENSLVCKNNHCYDIAKEGYVNLLLANMKKTKMPGDDKLMVQARKTFLDKDYYGKLKTEINKAILDYQPKILLDAGCGTGYYSNNLGAAIGVASAEAGYLLGDWILGKKKKKAKEMDGELEMKNGVNDNLSLSVAPTGIEFAIKL